METRLDLHESPLPDGLTPEAAVWLFKVATLPPGVAVTFLVELCRSKFRAPREVATAIFSHLEREGLLQAPAFLEALAPRQADLEQSPMGALLLGQCAEQRGDLQEAKRLYRMRDCDGAGTQDSAQLDLVRVLVRMGSWPDACAVLRQAAGASRDFAFLSRAAKQLARLKDHPRQACSRTIRMALLSPYTTDLWVPLLRLGLFREDIWGDIFVPPYGGHEQAILDPGSTLFAFDPEVVILAPTWRELNLPAFSVDPALAVKERVAELVNRWKLIRSRVSAHIIQHNFEIPAVDPDGHLGQVLPGGRAAIIQQINDQLIVEGDLHHITILSVDHLAGTYGKRAWADASYWFTAKQYPSPAALPALVDGQVTRIRAGLGLTKKVLVLDLDNTLWGGVIGEDGLDGIQIGPPSATGEAHLALQHYVAQLKERGILLAVCSKNNEADANAPFLEHEGMHLRRDDFVAFLANWNDKPTNLRSIAQTLNLGLDSFVFLDDNPIERALVRQELPQVAVPEIGKDPARYVEILDATGYFDADWLSPEDLDRSRNYLNNIKRQALQTTAGSLDAFLEGLNMTCEHGALNDHVLGRVVQLMGKTNQFNLTTRRHSDTQVRQVMADPGAWTHYFRLQDKFGDNGLVGVMIAVPSTNDPGAWEIDTWLMSCRVIGRQLENFMFNTLIAEAQERGISIIHGVHLPTAKNGMVKNLYQDLGFTEEEPVTEAARRFRIDPRQAPKLPATFIEGRP